MDIHFIRHGKTVANEQKLYCGKTDLPLSENGVADILNLKAQGIYPQNVDLFFTSPLIRTTQTLKYIYGDVCAEALPSLAEYHFGQFEMKSYEQLRNNADYQAWITDEAGLVTCPNGESKQAFMHRLLEGYNLLLEKSAQVKSTLVVSHGGVITSIMDYLFPNTHHFYEWQPKLGCGYTVSYDSIKHYEYKKI